MFEELKSCPFCGGEAVLYVDNGGVRVICEKCYCQTNIQCDSFVGSGISSGSIKRVVEKWNRRAAVNER